MTLRLRRTIRIGDEVHAAVNEDASVCIEHVGDYGVALCGARGSSFRWCDYGCATDEACSITCCRCFKLIDHGERISPVLFDLGALPSWALLEMIRGVTQQAPRHERSRSCAEKFAQEAERVLFQRREALPKPPLKKAPKKALKKRKDG